jgi:tRNA pseudouridine13 synthase
MKLKRIPEDFQVDELVALQPGDSGPFALYRLTKQSLGTREAIDAIIERWRMPRGAIAFAGLKDRHALTRQYVTIQSGPPRGFGQTNFELEYLGQVERPIQSKDITGNRFSIVLRDLSSEQTASALTALEVIARDGLPNYFDNQRFGSLGNSGQFIAQPWCLGNYDRAVWLAYADENVHDRPADRTEKQALRDHWGDWRKCRELVRNPERRRLIEFLAAYPDDFRRAIALPRQDLRSLWLAAFQSHLWNQMLAAVIRRCCRSAPLIEQTIGRRMVPLFTRLTETERVELRPMLLPLPSARLHLEPGRLQTLIDEALAAEGMELRQVRVKYPRDSFFSKGERAAVVALADLSHSAAADELHPGREKLALQFTLPRGAYATILVKRLTGVNPDIAAEDEEPDVT